VKSRSRGQNGLIWKNITNLTVYGEKDLRMQADFEKLRTLRPKEVLYRYASVRKVCDPEERRKKEK
jgi:hypothetical protein